MTDTPEKTRLQIGYIPLTDCMPLIIAKEQGFFDKHGLDVQLSREASWANIRDKICVGALDAAHMLAGMPLALSLGLGYSKKQMLTGFSINLNGNAITVSPAVFEELQRQGYDSDKTITSAHALKKCVEDRAAAGQPKLRFAMVYPYSMHNYEMRYWMAAGGINPDKDIELCVIPPPHVPENLEAGNIDGFCVGEPWNAYTVDKGIGCTLITGYNIWNNSPEKVLGVTQEWADRNPATHLTLIKALIEAVTWLEQDDNRINSAAILAREEHINIPADIINKSLGLNPENNGIHHCFHKYQASFPWRSHALWILTQMYRWGQLSIPIDMNAVARTVYRPDIYRQAAAELQVPAPSVDYKDEGLHDQDWTLVMNDSSLAMGADKFIDGQLFDPDTLVEYIKQFEINALQVDLSTLR